MLLLRPDLSGALFVNSGIAKALGIYKKAGTEGGKRRPKINLYFVRKRL